MAQDNIIDFDNEDYDPDIMTICDEDGKEHTVEVVDAIDYDGTRYLAIIPYEDGTGENLDQEAELTILRVSELDGEEVMDVVDDDDELYDVGQVFMERLESFFNIEE